MEDFRDWVFKLPPPTTVMPATAPLPCPEAGWTLKRQAASSFYSALHVGIPDHCRATARSAQPTAGVQFSVRLDARRRHQLLTVGGRMSSRTACLAAPA